MVKMIIYACDGDNSALVLVMFYWAWVYLIQQLSLQYYKIQRCFYTYRLPNKTFLDGRIAKIFIDCTLWKLMSQNQACTWCAGLPSRAMLCENFEFVHRSDTILKIVPVN